MDAFGGADVSVVQDVPGYNSWPMIQALGEKLVCAYSRDSGHTIAEGKRGVFARTSSGTAEDFCIDYIAVDSSRASKFKVTERSLIADRVTSDHAPIQVTVVPIP
jgi:endonuclease/exonuclease/phosphatase family metal-dependent hydrolase